MNETVIVDAGRDGSKIRKDIYGHFSEHLGRCIYGGFWVGKDSDIPNINGYRKDVVEAFKEIAIPNLRWPGGCFADEYHWKDGIGPYENRKKMINTNWGGVVEDNSFGTHEFLGLCEELGCKPYVNGNVGSGTVQEMAEWIEYMTSWAQSPMSNLRRENGRENPWKVDYFGVGNESWGCGGNMRAEHYVDLYRQYQTFVKQYGADKVYKIACGPSGEDYYWTEVLMKEAAYLMDGLSMHYYTVYPSFENKLTATGFEKKDWYNMIYNAAWIDTIIRRHSEIMDKYDPEKRVGLIVDEWGAWHQCEPGTNPGFLYQQNALRDALIAGISLNIFNNHADRVHMANIAQAVNVLQSPVLTEGNKMVKTPTWYVFHMYKNHQDGTLLHSSVATTRVGCEDSKLIDAISASASRKDNVYTITLTNADTEKAHNVNVNLDGLKGAVTSTEAVVLSASDMKAINTFDCPDTVVEKPLTVKTEGCCISVEMPAMSVVQLTVKA